MTFYTPDKWVIITITTNNKTYHKLLSGWVGGYLSGSEWRLNSGITKIESDPENNDYFLIYGISKSCYRCHRSGYGFTSLTNGIYNKMTDEAQKTGGSANLVEFNNIMDIDYEKEIKTI